MPRTANTPGESFKEIHFPKAGNDLSLAYSKQPNGPVQQLAIKQGQRYPTSLYARTTRIGNNVRGYEPVSGRSRGGQRPGLSKYLQARPGDVEWITQELTVLVT